MLYNKRSKRVMYFLNVLKDRNEKGLLRLLRIFADISTLVTYIKRLVLSAK